MKKNEKKCVLLLVITLIILFISNIVNATEIKNKLEVITQTSKVNLDEQGFISKTIISSDTNNGEVIIELKINNTKKEDDNSNFKDTEVYLMVSENIANDEKVLEKNIKNIESLSNKIFQRNSNTKIGIIRHKRYY